MGLEYTHCWTFFQTIRGSIGEMGEMHQLMDQFQVKLVTFLVPRCISLVHQDSQIFFVNYAIRLLSANNSLSPKYSFVATLIFVNKRFVSDNTKRLILENYIFVFLSKNLSRVQNLQFFSVELLCSKRTIAQHHKISIVKSDM